MARFERDGEFFEVWLERPQPGSDRHWPHLKYCTGPIGDDSAAAVEIEMKNAFSARNVYCEQQSQRLRDGWHRVYDRIRESAVDEPCEPSLDAAMLADPSDPGAAMVYSDWFQHRGHPRGALIAVQYARRDRPDDPALVAEEQRLLADHAEVLLGRLADHPSGNPNGSEITLGWELGFVRSARIDGYFEDGDSEDALWDVLRHPSCRYLRELEVGCHHAGDQDNVLMADLILRAGPRPPLRRLVLADFDHSKIDNIDISRAPLGDLSGLGQRYPLLEEVELKGRGDVVLGELSLPRARRFALRTSSLTRATLASILAAPWPELVELELWTGTEDHGGDVEPVDLDPLFAIGRFPKLRTLRLMNAMFTDELCAKIAAWPQARMLETLDFSLGTMSDVGAALLVGTRGRLAHLEELRVAECCLTPGGLAGLRDAGFPVDDQATHPARDHRNREQKSQRYVSVSE